MIKLDLARINKNIADRSNVFYWQTDRQLTPQEAGTIWVDRHRYFTDEELIDRVDQYLKKDKLKSVVPLNLNDQTNLGNVNSVREGTLASGREVIIRCHPKGVLNGYFYVEALAASTAKAAGLPSYDTIAVHDYKGDNDFSFHILEKLPGTAIQKWLEANPDDQEKLLPQIGKMMARLHQIEVNGYGPFDNAKAKNGQLVGLHQIFSLAVQAGLEFNLGVLQDKDIFNHTQVTKIKKLFSKDNPLLSTKSAVLVHNDFADWNLLTNAGEITGILDWDECVGGDPVSDIACWSTFFPPERLPKFLDGYFSVAKKSADFQDKFELLRFRYVISKMTLRIRRYTWEPSDSIKQKIEFGKAHLAESMKYFKINHNTP